MRLEILTKKQRKTKSQTRGEIEFFSYGTDTVTLVTYNDKEEIHVSLSRTEVEKLLARMDRAGIINLKIGE